MAENVSNLIPGQSVSNKTASVDLALTPLFCTNDQTERSKQLIPVWLPTPHPYRIGK